MISLKNKSYAVAKTYQQGATMWTTLSVVLMVCFMAMLAFKLVPIYIEHSSIKSSMQIIVDQPKFREMSKREISSSMQKRMMVDNIRGFDNDAFKVMTDKTGQKYILVVYSQKVTIFSNISALVEFNEEIRPSR